MGIPVEVPGLDTIIPELTEGRVAVLESAADPARSFFLRRLSSTALRSHWKVHFVTSRERGETLQLLSAEGGLPPWFEENLEVVERDDLEDLERYGAQGGLLAVDSFSFLGLERSAEQIAHVLRSLRALSRENRTTVLLGTDRGMLERRAEAVTTHLADGVIEFHAKEGPEGLIRFLRIPKWTDGKFVDRNIYYDFDGKRIAIDLRRRVL
ncbi:MAG: hypothetical protein L3J72_03540 [Thermoplasmata archaeon]|nr:hypothetical protein [Thermoplasmata archaeon]MCI4341020.1 hypothetical protein [Thermoplasmata archaeon]